MNGIKIHLFVILIIATSLSFGVWIEQTKITNDTHADVGRALTIVRDTTHQALKRWFKDQKAAAVAWAEDPEIRASTERLLALPLHQSTLQNSPDQQVLRAWFQRIEEATHYRNYFIIGPDHINVASSLDRKIGVENLLVEQLLSLAGTWAGQPVISLPTRSDIPLTDNHGRRVSDLPSMFVAAPIRNNADEVMAVFIFHLDPEEGFTNILKQGRIGKTGETYAFDSEARLISQSRFDDRLQEIGLVPTGEYGMLNILLRDPGENIIENGRVSVTLNQQPLTHMAESALRGETGVDVDGYRDYRGVPVVGAWTWDTELGLGISTELDVQEAYQTLSATRAAIVTLTVLALILLISATAVYSLYRQRKQSEEALRKSEKTLSAMFEQAAVGVALLESHSGKFIRVNKKFCDIIGYSEEEMLFLDFMAITHPDDLQEDLDNMQLLLDGKIREFSMEKRYFRKDNSIVWANLTVSPMWKVGAQASNHVAVVENITQRKLAEEELRRAASVFDNTDEGIIVTNAECNIIMVNKAFTDITGYKADEVFGRNPRLLQSGRHDASFYQTMWVTLKRDNQWRGEIWNRRKNGDIYPVSENINIVRDEKGRIANYVSVFTDISILKESEQRLIQHAYHDTLTGLPNRLRFMANLEQATESAKRNNHKVALLFLDLDGFKNVNDNFGHDIGDQLLITIAERLKSCVRSEDTVARLGGDEFTIILTKITKSEDAGLIADKIIDAIRKPIILNSHTINTSTSIGISIYPDDAVDEEELVKAADIAMYNSKVTGKDGFQFITAKLALRRSKHMQIEQNLRKAIENKEFELYYQPQVNLKDGKIVGLEALIRWNHPDYGQLLPEEFIHVADDSNLINAITDWVLRVALSDQEYWSNIGLKRLCIAINITGRQISSEESVEGFLNILKELKPEPNTLQIDLEISETSIESTERTIGSINSLKDRGVMFAIDDFGSGYSSLSRIKQLPIEALKINRSFISKIADNDDDKAIVAAIIAMAHSLGLRAIAEGVETQLQFDVLRALNCDEIQGFYFSKPVPASEIPRLIEKSFL